MLKQTEQTYLFTTVSSHSFTDSDLYPNKLIFPIIKAKTFDKQEIICDTN